MDKVLFACIRVCILLVTVYGAMAVPGGDFSDDCYDATWSDGGENKTSGLLIEDECLGVSVEWIDDLELMILGNVTDGEVVFGETWVYVDSLMRPDLDASAVLSFEYPPFAIEPDVLRDGTTCTECNVTMERGIVEVEVGEFSNYTLTYQQDFTVYSDYEPELKQKVYQTVDLGDGRRSQTYACVVQVFGRNAAQEWILVQTNPERKVQARILGNPDANQPESLGYFPTINGLANTYFRNDNLYGYMDFELVIQCTSNSSAKIVYEEPIMTQYSPAGRQLVSRGVWLSDGSNAFYVVIWVVLAFLVLWVGGLIWRSIR